MENASSSPVPNIQLGDVYYVAFRHKWKMVFCALVGLLGAIFYYKSYPPPYSSTARLFIRYVTESQGMKSTGEEELRTRTPDRGETNTEVAILTSLNLAKLTAISIGPEKILKAYGGGNDPDQAASVIRYGLLVEIAQGAAIINITFSHRDQEIVQPILSEFITQYLKRHFEIHRGGGMVDSFLVQQTDQLRTQLAQTEEESRTVRAKAGVISPEESKAYYATTISRLKQEILNAQTMRAEHIAVLNQLTKDTPTNSAAEPIHPKISSEVTQAYQDLLLRIETLRKREQDLLIQFTPENTQVKEVRASLAEAHLKKTSLESENPQLISQGLVSKSVNDDRIASIQSRITDTQSLLTAAEAKLATLNNQLEQVLADAARFDQSESTILELQRKKAIEEKSYMEYSANLAKARSADTLGSGQISNISLIQTPVPPFRNWKKTTKVTIGIAVFGVALGIGWAALVGFLLDRSIHRPKDVEQALKLPLFLSIPKQSTRKLASGNAGNTAKALDGAENTAALEAIAPYADTSNLNPYFETLRDRLIAYFESINLRHSPKLIAVTGLGSGSGVSTTAAGLARSLSETGAGNVLLVDMTQKIGQRTALPFSQGKAVANIDHILASQVADKGENKLFVVSEGTSSEKLSRQLPHRFNQLFPKLKASNFDYIIFDMPPVSQISITPRLASSMDTVLLMIESEKTDKEMAQRAAALLSKANANVGVILNKTNSSIPGNLLKGRDFLLDS